jgi:acyl-CoA reductase-like NAD-dependent aldehyde dehydrogenase
MNNHSLLRSGKHISSPQELSLTQRRVILRDIADFLVTHEHELTQALFEDLHKPWHEAWPAEIAGVLQEIRHIQKNLKKWTRSKKGAFCPLFFPGTSYSEPRPYGTVLIIAPWNYPLGLIFSPLIAAIAAGNRVIIKPSPRSKHTENLLMQLMGKHFNPRYIELCTADVDEVRAIISEKADFVCFTGSTTTGRAVMADAAKGPTPVLLELGGANPAFVFSHADLRAAARRIAWGKFFNSGQTCVAPNHCLVEASCSQDFISELENALEEFYGEHPQSSPDYGRMIDGQACDEAAQHLDRGTIVRGGSVKKEDRYISPTISAYPKNAAPPADEIFGPILPVIPVTDLEKRAQDHVQNSPLAVYGFGSAKKTLRILSTIPTGSLVINGTLHRMASQTLPFGGVGHSGFGRYHGAAGFDAFSRQKTVVVKHKRWEISAIYPPYTISKRILKFFMKFM